MIRSGPCCSPRGAFPSQLRAPSAMPSITHRFGRAPGSGQIRQRHSSGGNADCSSCDQEAAGIRQSLADCLGGGAALAGKGLDAGRERLPEDVQQLLADALERGPAVFPAACRATVRRQGVGNIRRGRVASTGAGASAPVSKRAHWSRRGWPAGLGSEPDYFSWRRPSSRRLQTRRLQDSAFASERSKSVL